MPSQKSAQKAITKAAGDRAGKPGQPKKASAAETAQKKKQGPVVSGGA